MGRVALALFALALPLLATPVFAHAQLLSSTPEAGTVGATAPATVDLNFNEPVTALAVALVDPDGNRTDLLDDTSSGTALVVHLPPGLAEGTYVLSWRAASTDSHIVASSLIFSIGHVTGAAVTGEATDRLVAIAMWAAKAILFAALFVAAGGALYRSTVESPERAG